MVRTVTCSKTPKFHLTWVHTVTCSKTPRFHLTWVHTVTCSKTPRFHLTWLFSYHSNAWFLDKTLQSNMALLGAGRAWVTDRPILTGSCTEIWRS